MEKKQLTNQSSGLLSRYQVIFFALLCVAFAHYLFIQPQSVVGDISLATEWNKSLYLALLYPNNTFVAVFLLLLGGGLFAWFMPQSLPSESSPANWTPFASINPRSFLLWSLIASALFLFLNTRLQDGDQNVLLPLLWLTVIVIISNFLWDWEQEAGTELSLGRNRYDYLCLLLLLGFGIIVGTYYLRDIPARVVGDEGKFWEIAHQIAEGTYKPSLFDSGVYSFSVASSIFQGWVLRLVGMNLWGWRFSSVLAGLLTVIPLFLLAYESFGRKVAIIASLIMITNPYFLAYARLGYNNSQALFPVTLAIYFWMLALKRGSYFYCWLAGLAAGLGFYTYTAGQLGIVMVVFFGLYMLLMRQLSLKRLFIAFSFVLLACLVMIAPRISFAASVENATPLYHKMLESTFANAFYGRDLFSDDELSKTQDLIEVGGNEFFYEPSLYSLLILRGVIRSILVYHQPFFGGDKHFVETGLAGSAIAAAFYTLGLIISLRSGHRRRFALLLLWLGSGSLFLSTLNTFPPRPAHLVVTAPVLALLTAIGLISVVEWLTEWSTQLYDHLNKAHISRLVLAACLLVTAYFNLQAYFGTMSQKYPSNIEHLLYSIAWRASPDTRILYVEPTPKHHDINYLLSVKLLDMFYQNLSPDALISDANLLQYKNLIVLAQDHNDERITQFVQLYLLNAGAPLPLRTEDGGILAQAITNSDLELSPDFTFINGLYSIIESPARSFLLLLGGLSIGVLLFSNGSGLQMPSLLRRTSFRPAQLIKFNTKTTQTDLPAANSPQEASSLPDVRLEITLRIDYKRRAESNAKQSNDLETTDE